MSFDSAAPSAIAQASDVASAQPRNAPSKLILASLMGTTIEFYDFYIFATAAALVIGPTFFSAQSAMVQTLAAFMSFAIAFIARPIGSLVFGHFGDRLGRKTTLVASLLTMGIATVGIGLLPGYGSIGLAAPIMLCVLRFAQGFGIGGEWGGAALLVTESAPEGKRGWYGMFPQLGPSLGFLMANGIFLALWAIVGNDAFMAWGWRVPFIISAALVIVGLYVRISLIESETFLREQRKNPVKAPLKEMWRDHRTPLVQGTLAMVACYAIFYITTVFTLNYATTKLGFDRGNFLSMLCIAVTFMAIATPVSAWASDRFGRRPVIITGLLFTILTGLLLGTLVGAASGPAMLLFLCMGLLSMGWIFSPMGALLPELFPTRVRYSGSSAAYNLAGILGASLAPYAAQALVAWGGVHWVGSYVVGMAILSLIAILSIKETCHRSM